VYVHTCGIHSTDEITIMMLCIFCLYKHHRPKTAPCIYAFIYFRVFAHAPIQVSLSDLFALQALSDHGLECLIGAILVLLHLKHIGETMLRICHRNVGSEDTTTTHSYNYS
jgi:hypothetical protein